MTEFKKFDKTAWYLTRAEEAARRAESSPVRLDRNMWLDLAQSWKFLAELQSQPCYCGRPSIGRKVFSNGAKLAVCERHMTELIVEDVLRKTGLKKPD
jgi:hypothetical protein